MVAPTGDGSGGGEAAASDVGTAAASAPLDPPSAVSGAPPLSGVGGGAAEIARRTATGRAAKRIIDAGRQLYLRSLFATVDLLQYCDASDSLENVLLIAHA